MPKNTLVCGILLAAGSGSRYGMPKVLAHDGVWLARALAALLDGGCDHVFLVVGAASVSPAALARASGGTWIGGSLPVSVVENEGWPEGMGSSLRAGLTAALAAESNPQLAVIHLVDTPDVGPEVVGRVIRAVRERAQGSNEPDAVNNHRRGSGLRGDLRGGLARANFGGLPGHPVAIGRRFWRELISSAEGDVGARGFLRDRDDVVAVECSDLATGQDHDEPGDARP